MDGCAAEIVGSVAPLKTLLVGVIGHVDHGKTALVRALTGVETDRLKEERDRGVSIVPGFALLASEQGEIDLVDLPGHERFVRAMVSGATGMSAVLLAVDANEGIKPQTVEHLEIARLIGVRRGVLALTKSDLATPAEITARAAEIAAAAARAGLEAPPVIATSTLTGAGIPDLAQALAAQLAEVEPRVDDGFLPAGRPGLYPAGIRHGGDRHAAAGTLAVGDTLEIVPGGRSAVVRSLQIHGRPVERAEPGRRTAVALRGVGLDEIARGDAHGAGPPRPVAMARRRAHRRVERRRPLRAGAPAGSCSAPPRSRPGCASSTAMHWNRARPRRRSCTSPNRSPCRPVSPSCCVSIRRPPRWRAAGCSIRRAAVGGGTMPGCSRT
ncbi:Selenocysteine-specific elongation factor [Methylobacterium brachiatum]|nr:Selenocysteine-specific elongation factor [Methylobacterium brachiatum]